MGANGTVDNHFTNGFNEANNLCEQDQMEEGITKARELLAEPSVPRYHKMKFLMLLASALEDWYDANEGEDAALDADMSEVRALLDTCDRILQQERDELDAEDGVEDSMLLDDQGTADAQGMMENMDIGAEEDNEAGRAKKDRAEESSGAGKRGPATGIPVHIPSCSRDHAGKCRHSRSEA
ncbi:hypothetical protein HBH51_203750 [Parastagonospora nodorum]|nr:hypothetical protein HBH51_203750 [Parastagonospora nodorum]